MLLTAAVHTHTRTTHTYTATCPLQGETLKWPLKLHCNHTQLKTTRKCLPYAPEPCVSVSVGWRWIIDRSGRRVSGADELTGGDSRWPRLWSDRSEPLSCQSASWVATVWCNTGLREDQALPELALPSSPSNGSPGNTSNADHPPSPTPPFFRCELMNYF